MTCNQLGDTRDRRSWLGLGVATVVVLLVLAPLTPARSQDTLQVGPRPSVHIVQQGETLWELARLYFGDPFLWPEIYRINTLVVEDPHWIFPGEELRLVIDTSMVVTAGPPPAPDPVTGEVPEQVQGVDREPMPDDPPPEAPPVELPGAPPPPPPVEQAGPTVFAQTTPVVRNTIDLGPMGTYRAVRRGDFYAAGFLTENQSLPWAEVRGRVDLTAGEEIGGHTAHIFGRIRVRAPQGATYHVGDSLLTARLSREVPGWGRVVVPTGLARVLHESGGDVIAEVVAVYGRVTPGQVAMPVEPFRETGNARPAPVGEGLAGAVIEPRDEHPVPNQQDIVFIDVGRQDGVVPGDLFELVRPRRPNAVRDAPPERVAVIQIVHVREQSASGKLIELNSAGVRPGVPVRLIGKMPS